MPARVGLNEDRARLAADERVVGPFDPAEPDVVDTDVAKQVRRQLAVRVAPLVLANESDAFHLQVGHTSRLIGRHLTTDVGKVLAFADAVGHRSAIVAFTVAERTAESRCRLIGVAQLGRNGVDRVRVDTAREDATVAVENLASLGGGGDGA